jgi:hypothetical protein
LFVGPQLFATAGGQRATYEWQADEERYEVDQATAPDIMDGFMGGDAVVELPGTETSPALTFRVTLPAPGALDAVDDLATGQDLGITWAPSGAHEIGLFTVVFDLQTMAPVGFCSCDAVDDGSSVIPFQACFGETPGIENGDLLLVLVRRFYRTEVPFQDGRVRIDGEVNDQLNLALVLTP